MVKEVAQKAEDLSTRLDQPAYQLDHGLSFLVLSPKRSLDDAFPANPSVAWWPDLSYAQVLYLSQS